MAKRLQLNELLGRPKIEAVPTQEQETDQQQEEDITRDLQNEESGAGTHYDWNQKVESMPTQIQSFRFNDLKGSFRPFKGEPGNNISNWINHFEDNAETFQLTELQKLVFAKNLFEGQAKLYAEYESRAKTWKQLRTELLTEFGEQSNSLLIHQELTFRQKHANETNVEYLYEMLTIGSRGNVDVEAILTHTTNGLPGPTHSKTILYGAKDLREYKHNLRIYELQQRQTHGEPKKSESKTRNTVKIHCTNCGSPEHAAANCPRKQDGPKCFKCNEFGHRSFDDECPKKNEPPRRPRITTMRMLYNASMNRKNIIFNGTTISAVIDTGSESSVVQTRILQILGITEWEFCETSFISMGHTGHYIGRIHSPILIDGKVIQETFYIIENQESLPAVIIGMSLLSRCTLRMELGQMYISPVEEQNEANFLLWPNFKRMTMFRESCRAVMENLMSFTKMLFGKIFPARTERQKTIIIEGNIGAGKTTLTSWLSNNTDYLIIPEPLEKWHCLNGFNLLKAYYENQEQWAMTFQSYTILTMMKRHWYTTNSRIKIMERSLMSTDKCFIPLMFKNNVLNKQQKEVLQEWISFLTDIFEFEVDAIIYIRTDPKTNYDRIRNRARLGENRITLTYLQNLHELYDEWLRGSSEIPIYEINGMATQDEVTRQVLDIINHL